MALTDNYRSKLDQEAIERLEETIRGVRQRKAGYQIHYFTLGVSDIERLLYYVVKLEHELAYRDALANAPAWFKE
jgi:hypothetical protein